MPDNTEDVRNALIANKHVILTGHVFLKELAIPSRSIIECAPNTVVQGVSKDAPMIHTTGSVHSVNICNGTWQNASTVWEHTGRSAVSWSLFDGMVVRGCANGFALSTSVGNEWRRVLFGYGGVLPDLETAVTLKVEGQCNQNRWSYCQVRSYRTAGLVFGGSNIAASNVIDQCWFENAQGPAFISDAVLLACDIRGGYFDGLGESTKYAIEINNTAQACTFHSGLYGAKAGTHACIYNTNKTSYCASRNRAQLIPSKVFAHINGLPSYHVELLANYLNASGGGSYSSRLFRRSTSQQVSWSNHVPSGGVTGDETPQSGYEHG